MPRLRNRGAAADRAGPRDAGSEAVAEDDAASLHREPLGPEARDQGTPTYLLPIAQFDLEDRIKGYDSLDFEGVKFYLGDDSGLEHSWVDSSALNGFTYYYAITSYDFGYTAGGITPSECNINLSLNSDGSVKSLGKNVAVVTPEAPSGGYKPPTLGEIDLVQGYTTSQVSYQIIDPNEIQDCHVYYITFEDTIKSGTEDTLTTKNFSLYDSTANFIVIDRKIGEAARKTAEEKADWKKNFGKLLDVYNVIARSER